MYITASSLLSPAAGHAGLKGAQQQPELAGELIRKSIEGLQTQVVQSSSQPVTPSSVPQTGGTVDLFV